MSALYVLIYQCRADIRKVRKNHAEHNYFINFSAYLCLQIYTVESRLLHTFFKIFKTAITEFSHC